MPLSSQKRVKEMSVQNVGFLNVTSAKITNIMLLSIYKTYDFKLTFVIRETLSRSQANDVMTFNLRFIKEQERTKCEENSLCCQHKTFY
jgi:hypothetical protein